MTVPQNSPTDVLIIGGSHAGLSAALALYRSLHTSIIFDSGKPRNQFESAIHLTPTWENRSPVELRNASRHELLATGLVSFVDAEIHEVTKTDDGTFRVTCADGRSWLGKKVLLATGAADVFPDLPGYQDLYAKQMYVFTVWNVSLFLTYRRFPCMFQFGYELRGSPSAGLLAIGSLANPMHALILAKDGYRFTERMTIYTNGNLELYGQLKKLITDGSGLSVDNREIAKLGQNEKGTALVHFKDGSQEEQTFLVHRPSTKIDTKLTDQLGLKLSAMGEIEAAPPFCKTNVTGVYAAGDCASMMKTISHAMMTGSYAACGIARELPKI